MRPFRVMLADPPILEQIYSYQHPTLGLLYLAGAIRKAFTHRDVDVRYQTGFGTIKDHLQAIADYEPDLYCISFKTPMARLASRTMHSVRSAFPKLPIVAGGVHCSAMPQDVLNTSPANACFGGECERSIVSLIAAFRGPQTRFEDIPGAVVRDGLSYYSARPAPLTPDIDSLAWPAWDLVDHRKFSGMNYERSGVSLGVVVSRGCPWKCTFCSEPIWKINGSPTFRARSPEQIVAEILYHYERGIRDIRLWCEELNANVGWACKVLRAIAALKLPDLRLNSNIRADRVTPELADSMAEANLRVVCSGIESASQETLNGILKQAKREQIEASCSLLKSRGIKTLGYFLLYPAWEKDGELRFENTRDAYKTIFYALRLRRLGLLDYMSLSIATPRPSAPMWDLAHKYKLFRTSPSQPFYYMEEGMALPGISYSEMRRALLMGRMLQAGLLLTGGSLKVRAFSSNLHKLWRAKRAA